MLTRNYYVYLMASPSGTLYVGMTNNLAARVMQHKTGSTEGFAKKYGCTKLVYYEATNDVNGAIAKEKEIKKWRRDKKEMLIRSINPGWHDLYSEIA